jgi:hypothetical protein
MHTWTYTWEVSFVLDCTVCELIELCFLYMLELCLWQAQTRVTANWCHATRATQPRWWQGGRIPPCRPPVGHRWHRSTRPPCLGLSTHIFFMLCRRPQSLWHMGVISFLHVSTWKFLSAILFSRPISRSPLGRCNLQKYLKFFVYFNIVVWTD